MTTKLSKENELKIQQIKEIIPFDKIEFFTKHYEKGDVTCCMLTGNDTERKIRVAYAVGFSIRAPMETVFDVYQAINRSCGHMIRAIVSKDKNYIHLNTSEELLKNNHALQKICYNFGGKGFYYRTGIAIMEILEKI